FRCQNTELALHASSDRSKHLFTTLIEFNMSSQKESASLIFCMCLCVYSGECVQVCVCVCACVCTSYMCVYMCVCVCVCVHVCVPHICVCTCVCVCVEGVCGA